MGLSVLRRNVGSMALQASLAFSSTSYSPLSVRVARSLLAATPSPTPLPSPGQIRFKRVNIQKPRRPDWFRQQLLAVAAPRFSQPQTLEEMPDSCEMAARREEEVEWKEHINQWENCLHFFMNFPGEHTQPILFSPKTDPKKLLAYEKKVPEFQLLAVVVHGRILSKAGVQDLVNMPDLATQRAELSTLLSFNQRKTLSLLGANQQSLSTNLDQYVKDRTK